MDSLRPEIIKSWHRSKNIDPLKGLKPRLSEEMLDIKQNESRELLSAARPIMEELFAMIGKGLVCIADDEGYVLEVIGNAEFLPPGTPCKENQAGTNCIGTSLVEERPLEISGYEHYRRCLHSLNSAAAPIKGDSEIIGAVCVISPFHDLPKDILQIVSFAAKTIGSQVSEKTKIDSIIDCLQYGLFIIDGNGTIININKRTQELLGLDHRKDIISKPLSMYVPDAKDLLEILMGESLDKYTFEIITRNRIFTCTLRVQQKLRKSTNPQETVILFSFSDNISTTKRPPKLKTHPHLFTFDDLVGSSPTWRNIVKLGTKAARVNSTILLTGESGTGKEMFAQAIHSASNRKGPLVPINCGAIPRELLQSELFGYIEGSFTGAKKGGSLGKFEMADSGTLFLDEIGEMPMEMQVSLLRFLQDKKVIRVGAAKSKDVDVRIIAATNIDLEEAVSENRFRDDLYYRLNVIKIELPPLRDRKEDIPGLVNSIIQDLSQEVYQDISHLENETLEVLMTYNWPGNVRELRNVIEHAVVFAEGNPITPECLPFRLLDFKEADQPKDLKGHELEIIKKFLDQNNGNISETARALGITRSTLYRKLNHIKNISIQ